MSSRIEKMISALSPESLSAADTTVTGVPTGDPSVTFPKNMTGEAEQIFTKTETLKIGEKKTERNALN